MAYERLMSVRTIRASAPIVTIRCPPDEPVIIISRSFDAPRALVWKAWTGMTHVARWWGPDGFTTPRCYLDVRTGGGWRIESRAPDGSIFTYKGRYLDVAAPERIVNTLGLEGIYDESRVVETHTFTEWRGVTRYVGLSRFHSLDDRDRMLDSGIEEDASEGLNRLAQLLRSLKAVSPAQPQSSVIPLRARTPW